MHRLLKSIDNNEEERHENPRSNANFFEIHSFWWMFNLFKTGYSRDLNENDLYKTLKDHSSSLLGDELEKTWKLEMNNTFEINRKPSLLKVLNKMFGSKYMFYGFILCISELSFKIFQPILIGKLLAYFNSNSSEITNYWHAYISASSLVLCIFITMVLNRSAQTKMNHCGMKIRVACSSMIFRKTLSLSHKSLGKTTVGQVMNLLSNDVNRFDTSLIFLHYMWIGPMQSMIVTYFLWEEIGVLSLLGVATFFFFIPLQGWLGKKLCQQISKIPLKTDKRIRLMNEIVSGIQLIKMYAWEKSFAKLIEHARKKEIQQISRSLFLKLVLAGFKLIQTRIQLFIIILVHVTFSNSISAQKVFVIVSFYNVLQYSMTTSLVLGLKGIAELQATIKRIQMFLLLEGNNGSMCITSKSIQKMDNNGVKSNVCNDDDIENHMFHVNNKTKHSNRVVIDILNATAKWTDIEANNSLEDINLTIESGRLVAVIGPVGAGKSSLIHLILQELHLSQGRISVHGEISYASQEPWLFAGSIKQNIVFISQIDEKRYKQVIEVCALAHDLQQFPDGDRTIVGERGVTLSGGQRARINLARAVYKEADIYLLDDPLSAVDSYVGKHLFESCIRNFLKGKTCILVTHQLQYLNSVDEIVLMENAKISAKGSYQEIQTSGFDFAKLLESSKAKSNELNNKVLNKNPKKIDATSTPGLINLSKIIETKQNRTLAEPNEKAKLRSLVHDFSTIFISYFSTVGNIWKIILFFFMYIFTQILVSGGDYWLNFWVNQEDYGFGSTTVLPTDNRISVTQNVSNTIMPLINNRQSCVFIYTILIILMILVILIRNIVCVAVCMKASINLHNSVFKTILKGSLFFFNSNSSGEFINRFSNDIGNIDDVLPDILSDAMQVLLSIFGVAFIVGLVNIYFLILTFIIGITCLIIRHFFIPTSQSIRRLEGVTRSPVLTHMNTSLQGLTTIRAFRGEHILSKEFDDHQDLHSSAYYLFFTSNHAFGLWLEMACLIYLCIIIFCFLIFDKNSIKGYVGLVLTQIINVVSRVQWGMRQWNALENQMNSVKRVLEYKEIPQEADPGSSSVKVLPKGWPISGKIIFQNFNLQYSPNSQYVLKNLNFQIQPMEKVGIVGRTGAGKSSITNALFRLAFNDGKILIDDIDIHEIGLNALRSKLSIIPQEPVLFSGTIRKNLDPFDDHPDHVLWNALDEVKLKVEVENLSGGLNAKMSSSGSNFSVGERQLMCLARAIIRNNKIIVLDEATANVDQQTDAVIQNTIKNKFQKCTVLTIAHRLNTVIDSDRILVVDAGSIVEFDHPFNLLKHKGGFFYNMVEETGQKAAELLERVATKNFMNLQINREYIRYIDDDKTNVNNFKC